MSDRFLQHCSKRQISPSGVLLQNISPDEVFLKKFARWDCFLRGMHAYNTQIASTTGEFGDSEGIAACNGDIAMHRELPV